MDILESLIVASEKAANIARRCRHEQHLFELLIQEKRGDEANPRFEVDFKTLADVLIQETVKYDVGRKFPGLKDSIRGEENNKFCNRLGETVYVQVLDSPDGTADLLCKVLDGDSKAAALLAQEVHKEVRLSEVNTAQDIRGLQNLELNSLAVWIDPIDSTSEYITGIAREGPSHIYLSGLQCVTVLIGVYDKRSGTPLIGIVNQPFNNKQHEQWRGLCYWGICDTSVARVTPTSTNTDVVCISSSEDEIVRTKFKANGFTLVEAAGAGYKILAVISGAADAYVLTRSSTFKWDTCGPQAVLSSLGGGLIVFDSATRGEVVPVDYKDGTLVYSDGKIERYCNRGGIIAYKNNDVLERILAVLKQI